MRRETRTDETARTVGGALAAFAATPPGRLVCPEWAEDTLVRRMLRLVAGAGATDDDPAGAASAWGVARAVSGLRLDEVLAALRFGSDAPTAGVDGADQPGRVYRRLARAVRGGMDGAGAADLLGHPEPAGIVMDTFLAYTEPALDGRLCGLWEVVATVEEVPGPLSDALGRRAAAAAEHVAALVEGV